MLLFPRTVYCSAQYFKAVQFYSQRTHPTHSELSSLETHEPENTIARPWLTVNSPLVPELECLQSPHRVPKNPENDSLLAHCTFTLICKPDPALCLLHRVLVLVILSTPKGAEPLSHSLPEGALPFKNRHRFLHFRLLIIGVKSRDLFI